MSANRNARADSRLKRLPEARQAQIIEMMKAPGMTQTKVRAELAKDGLKTSEPALSEFFSWWHRQQQFRQASDFSEDFQQLLKKADPQLSDEQLQEYGQRVFQMHALQLAQADPEAAALIWHRTQKLNLQAEIVKLEQQKFQRETCALFLKWAEDQRAKDIAASGGISQAEKIAQLGQLMFGDTWDAGTK
jgi:hypothetical protein